MRIMGMKFLNLPMIRPLYCFQLMGNPAHDSSCAPYEHQLHPSPPAVMKKKNNNKKKKKKMMKKKKKNNNSSCIIKLIKTDGLVRIYDRPIKVSELMLEYPKHLVCHSDSFYIGQKIPALSDKDKLQLGHNYFLLPKHLFQSVLSFVTIASFATASSSSQLQTNCKPFDIQKTASGCLKIHVSDEFISQLMEEEEDQGKEEELHLDSSNSSISGAAAKRSRICNTPQLEKDYMQLVAGCRRRHWKPKLESIRETEKKKRKLVLLSSSSFRMKKRSTRTKPSQPPPATSPLSHHHNHLAVHLSTGCAVKPPSISSISCSKPTTKMTKFRSINK